MTYNSGLKIGVEGKKEYKRAHSTSMKSYGMAYGIFKNYIDNS